MRKCGNWVLNDCLARHSNLEVVVGLRANGASRILAEGFLEIRVESAQTIRAGLLPRHHKDPFDRLLVAQAHATGWPIISADPVFDHYGVRRIR